MRDKNYKARRKGYQDAQKRKSAESRPREKMNNIAGLAAVAAVFAKNPQNVERLFFDESMKAAASPFCAAIAGMRKTYRVVKPEELAKIAGTPMHGGIVAVTKAQEPALLDGISFAEWAKDGLPLLILDGIGNPHNLGAIARTAAFLGLKRIVLSSHPQQAGLSDAAYRTAEGGISHIEFYRAADLPAALKKLRPHYRTLAATLSGHPVSLAALKPADKPCALVLGNEEDGVSEATQRACETPVKIPGTGAVQSLNVSASAAILLYTLLHPLNKM